MPDTPLHKHPAVVHLMGTKHWPKRGHLSLGVGPTGAWGWYTEGRYGYHLDGGYPSLDGDATAHSLITLAAETALFRKQLRQTPLSIALRRGPVLNSHSPLNPDNKKFYVAVYIPLEYTQYFFADTELEATLMAYQAICMSKEA